MVLDKEFFTVPQVAALFQVHSQTVYGYVYSGRLKALSFGKSLRFRRDDIEKFLSTLDVPRGGAGIHVYSSRDRPQEEKAKLSRVEHEAVKTLSRRVRGVKFFGSKDEMERARRRKGKRDR